MTGPAHRIVWKWLVYTLLALGALCVLPWWGSEVLSPHAVWAQLLGESSPAGMIFFQQRLPRVLLALLVGGLLSLTGAALQVLFRNPLAEPWTLGVAGGAAVGAFTAQAFPVLQHAVGPVSSTQLFALLGAGGVMMLIFLYSRSGAVSTQTLLLAGVTISIVSGSLVMLVTYFISPYKLMAYHRWMMGGLDVLGFQDVWMLLIPGLPGAVLLLSQARAYNHLTLGEETAMGHGVDVARVQVMTLLGAGLTTAACVTVAGPIGFVGMIIPHAVRRFGGYDNRFVLPASFLLGGAVLAVCDGAARTLIAPTEIPVGIITAVFGGPLFLHLLTRKRL